MGWGRDYAFIWPIADVWETCLESVIISAIPFEATNAETTHCWFKHIYLIHWSVKFDSRTNELTSPTTTFTETHVSVNLKTPGTCHMLSFSWGARTVTLLSWGIHIAAVLLTHSTGHADTQLEIILSAAFIQRPCESRRVSSSFSCDPGARIPKGNFHWKHRTCYE